MKRVQLRLVADNTGRVAVPFGGVDRAAAPPPIDYRSAMRRVQQVFATLAAIGLAPFRALAWLVNTGAAIGLGFFRGLLKMVLAVFGLTIALVVLYGLAHVVLWPMFHR
jgi:hypothetical protein